MNSNSLTTTDTADYGQPTIAAPTLLPPPGGSSEQAQGFLSIGRRCKPRTWGCTDCPKW